MSKSERSRFGWVPGLVLALLSVEVVAVGAAVVVPKSYQPPEPPLARLPVVASSSLGGARNPGPDPSPAAVARCLGSVLPDPSLGPRVMVGVTTLAGRSLFASGPSRATPASTLKLLTTTAALSALGPDHRFSTTVVRRGDQLTLVGGGDPLLATTSKTRIIPGAATLADLADQVSTALGGSGQQVTLAYDTSLFPGPAAPSAWKPTYIPQDVVSPISALWVQEGHAALNSYVRVPDPAVAAAQAFQQLLLQRGLKVSWAGEAPVGSTGRVVAQVQSPPLRDIVRHVLAVSDNEAAEVLARQVALATGRPGTAAAAPVAVRAQLKALGVPLTGLRTYDGSGLSHRDLVPRATLEAVLALDASNRTFRPVIADLPVSAFSGTLADRFTGTSVLAAGIVHGKTGSLTGVDALAGYVVDADGVPLIFQVAADRVPVSYDPARSALDRIATALAGCGA